MKTIPSLSLKNSPIPIAIMQVGGQIVATSDALFSFFEYSSNQTITDITDLFGEVSEAFNKGIRTKRVVCYLEYDAAADEVTNVQMVSQMQLAQDDYSSWDKLDQQLSENHDDA